jgi:hypothetical protein
MEDIKDTSLATFNVKQETERETLSIFFIVFYDSILECLAALATELSLVSLVRVGIRRSEQGSLDRRRLASDIGPDDTQACSY